MLLSRAKRLSPAPVFCLRLRLISMDIFCVPWPCGAGPVFRLDLYLLTTYVQSFYSMDVIYVVSRCIVVLCNFLCSNHA